MESNNLIAIAADHAGFELKEFIKENFKTSHKFQDYGTTSATSVDYPDFAKSIIQAIENNLCEKAILICGSGVGMCIAANRSRKVRAALCQNPELTALARQHNDINVLVLGARFITKDTAIECIKSFLTTEFEGGRHQQRINKLS